MLTEDRKTYIQDLLERQPSVSVRALSETLGISEVTVRKLLMQMESEGLLKRAWGGAVRAGNTSQELPYTEKENRHVEEKRAIAQAAYMTICDGETVYLDCGTTSFELVKCIVEGSKHLIVCTNAFNILAELRRRPDLQSIMIGGELRPAIYSCVGPLTVQMLSLLVFDRAFITGDHFSLEHGFSVSTLQDAAVKQAVMKTAKCSYVIMDSSKYGDDSMAVVFPPDADLTLITDWRLPDAACAGFEACGISVMLANAPREPKKTRR